MNTGKVIAFFGLKSYSQAILLIFWRKIYWIVLFAVIPNYAEESTLQLDEFNGTGYIDDVIIVRTKDASG